MPRTVVDILVTADTEDKARKLAAELWKPGRRVGVARTLDWNRWHPNRPAKTVNRFVVYEERPAPR